MSKEHALAILGREDTWNWHDTARIQHSGKHSGKFHTVTSKFLYHLINESQAFGGDVLPQFWKQLGACHERLQKNIESLKGVEFVSAEESFSMLFQGLDSKCINFKPVLDMAAEFFTHLCVAFMNPGGSKSGSGTTSSVSKSISDETGKLLEELNKKSDFGDRKPFLKELAFKRDGTSCLLTGLPFLPYNNHGLDSQLAHIIPNAIHGKMDTLKCIAMFAGVTATDMITKHLNDLGNLMNMEYNAHRSYDKMEWGIEAKEEPRKETKYFFHMTKLNEPSPLLFTLKEGDEIQFGRGPDGKELGSGPNPMLCNLRLAVARVLKMSGAADIVMKWKDEGDDSECGHLFIASEEFLTMLDAKLLLSGRAIVVI